MTSDPPIIRLRDVRVEFGGLRALDTKLLDIPGRSGLAAVFIGPNGAGKTTLLNVVSGYVRLVTGEITFEGPPRTRLNGLSRAAMVRAGVARTFQTPIAFESLTVREGVRLAALAGQDLNAATRMKALWQTASAHHGPSRLVDELIEELDLRHVADALTPDLPLHLSRRAELARCLAAQPRVLFLDEPTAGADNQERDYLARLLTRHLVSLVGRLADANLYRHRILTVGLVTHDMFFAREVSRETDVPPIAFFLDQGRLVTFGSLDAVTADARVRRIYLGEEQHVDA